MPTADAGGCACGRRSFIIDLLSYFVVGWSVSVLNARLLTLKAPGIFHHTEETHNVRHTRTG